MMSIKHVFNPCVKVTWNSIAGDQANDTVVFMHASGLCIDISDQDPSTYVIGTDEGLIHRCSTSYNEQYLDTYLGHTAPVNRVSITPRGTASPSTAPERRQRRWYTHELVDVRSSTCSPRP